MLFDFGFHAAHKVNGIAPQFFHEAGKFENIKEEVTVFFYFLKYFYILYIAIIPVLVWTF